MRDFQKKAIEQIEPILESHSVFISWNEQRRPELPGLGYVEGDVDLVGTTTSEGKRIEIWIYVDELGLYVDADWTIFEQQDYRDAEDDHIREFCSHLESQLA